MRRIAKISQPRNSLFGALVCFCFGVVGVWFGLCCVLIKVCIFLCGWQCPPGCADGMSAICGTASSSPFLASPMYHCCLLLLPCGLCVFRFIGTGCRIYHCAVILNFSWRTVGSLPLYISTMRLEAGQDIHSAYGELDLSGCGLRCARSGEWICFFASSVHIRWRGAQLIHH